MQNSVLASGASGFGRREINCAVDKMLAGEKGVGIGAFGIDVNNSVESIFAAGNCNAVVAVAGNVNYAVCGLGQSGR